MMACEDPAGCPDPPDATEMIVVTEDAPAGAAVPAAWVATCVETDAWPAPCPDPIAAAKMLVATWADPAASACPEAPTCRLWAIEDKPEGWAWPPA